MRVGLTAAALLLSLAAAEGLLRLQQSLGPFYDLELQNLTHLPSETLNHEHARIENLHLDDPAKYGRHAGFAYRNRYDDAGLRVDPELGRGAETVLFMGDSFMEGYDDANTLPRHVLRWLSERNEPGKSRKSGKSGMSGGIDERFRFANAGTSSYSPAIYIVQAKQLIPELRPSLVVIDIDETDLGDDALRYEPLTIRDERGEILAVRSTKARREFVTGFLDIKRRHSLYVVRLVLKAYHARWSSETRQNQRALRQEDIEVLRFQRDQDEGARANHRPEIELFEANLAQLADTLVSLMGSRERILFAYHPHREQLTPGARWTPLVAESLERVTRARGLAYYDASEDVRRALGGAAERIYWAGEMHFNFEGLKLYGELLAAKIAPLLPPG